MLTTETRNGTASSASVRIIATGIVIGFCYWAASVVMTLLVSILIAYMLDPVVEWLERFRIPRGVGALIVVLVSIGLIVLLGAAVYGRAAQFAENWPAYSAILKEAASDLQKKIEKIVPSTEPATRPAVRLAPESPWQMLLRGLGSLYSILLFVSFVPFLVFFMLAAKRDVWHGTLQLFPSTERTRVKQALDAVSSMLRSYVVGNLIVAAILAVASWLFFWMIGLDYPFLAGLVSGTVNLVPYLGVVLAWIPPLVVVLTTFRSMGPFIGIAAVLAFFHLIAVNVLMPALVGKKVHLNALAVTISLLFWGWLWGGIGLILAIPITATMKVICDHVDGWEPVGRWIGT